MTAPITWGGQHLGQFDNITGAIRGNLCGVSRLLCAGLNMNMATIGNGSDYTLQLGYILNFSGVGTTATNTTFTSTTPYVPGNWISGQFFVIDQVVYNNPSVSMTTASVGINTVAQAGSGNVVIVTNAAISGLTATTNGTQLLPSLAANAQTNTLSVSNLYLRVNTQQAASGTNTIDCYIFGKVFP